MVPGQVEISVFMGDLNNLQYFGMNWGGHM